MAVGGGDLCTLTWHTPSASVTSSVLAARRLTSRCKAVCREAWKAGVFPVRISQFAGLSPMSKESFLPFAFSFLLFWFVSFIDVELVQILLPQLLSNTFLRWSQHLILAKGPEAAWIFSLCPQFCYLHLGETMGVPISLYKVHKCSIWSN